MKMEETSAYMIRLFSCVNAQVTLQCLKMAKVCSTDLARVWLLSRVNQNVGTQMGHLRKQETLRTWPLDESIIHSFFSFLTQQQQMFSYLYKASTARLTLVRLLSRVDAGVGLQVGWAVELSPTDVAAIWLFTLNMQQSCSKKFELNQSCQTIRHLTALKQFNSNVSGG